MKAAKGTLLRNKRRRAEQGCQPIKMEGDSLLKKSAGWSTLFTPMPLEHRQVGCNTKAGA
jgi:hypothetical protein